MECQCFFSPASFHASCVFAIAFHRVIIVVTITTTTTLFFPPFSPAAHRNLCMRVNIIIIIIIPLCQGVGKGRGGGEELKLCAQIKHTRPSQAQGHTEKPFLINYASRAAADQRRPIYRMRWKECSFISVIFVIDNEETRLQRVSQQYCVYTYMPGLMLRARLLSSKRVESHWGGNK